MSFKKKFKTEAGQGGKRGHSNMTHWMHTEELKALSRKLRRRAGKEEARAQEEG